MHTHLHTYVHTYLRCCGAGLCGMVVYFMRVCNARRDGPKKGERGKREKGKRGKREKGGGGKIGLKIYIVQFQCILSSAARADKSWERPYLYVRTYFYRIETINDK